MATSSIFTTVKIDTKEKAEMFLSALEESSKKVSATNLQKVKVASSRAEIRALLNKRKRV